MKKIRVLIFPCGAENAIEIHTALKDAVNLEIFGASSRDDHGSFIFKNYIDGVPFIQEDNFLEAFNSIIETNEIDVVFPTHDTVSLFLAKHSAVIKAKLALPGFRQAHVCRYKNETYQLFADTFFCPLIYQAKEDVTAYPVFIKPIVGEGGKGTKLIQDGKDPLLQAGWEKDYVLMEYLPGDELTVDCFSDRHGVLRFTGPRKRHRTFGGISVNSFTIPISEEIRQIAEIINNRLQLRGLWFFQVKQNVAGDYKLLEVSVRTAGTMNLYRNLGVNFPLLTIYDLLDYEINIICNDYYLEVDRALFNRYRSSLQYDTIYIDFDDTITKNKLPNPFVMMFLFNARNNGKCIKVITRHEFDFDQTLHELGIHKSLFTEVIHLDWTTKKYLSIKETKDVIFIDNAYVERAEVHTHLGIPVFDVDAIQSLINWKE